MHFSIQFIEQLYLYENYTINATQIMLSVFLGVIIVGNLLAGQDHRAGHWWISIAGVTADDVIITNLTLYNPQSAQIILITADLGAFNLYLVRAGSDN